MNGRAVERERAADDRQIAGEAPSPEPGTQQDRGRTVQGGLRLRERPAHRRQHAEDVEKVVRHSDRDEPLRLAPAGQRVAAVPEERVVRRHPVERGHPVAPRFEHIDP